MAVVNDRLKQNKGKSHVDFRTPPEVFRYCQSRFGHYDLDVAASSENTLCPLFYSSEFRQNDALNEDNRWEGRVWCNPPYNNIKPWVAKALREMEGGSMESITLLVPASTCTKWFKSLWESIWCSDIVFISGRLSFVGPHIHPDTKKATATNPSVLIHLEADFTKPQVIELVEREVIMCY